MATNLEIIFTCLQNSSLAKAEQERFLGFCSLVGDGGLENIAQTLRNDPETITAMMKILEMKWTALKDRDQDSFKQVVAAELEEIKKTDLPA